MLNTLFIFKIRLTNKSIAILIHDTIKKIPILAIQEIRWTDVENIRLRNGNIEICLRYTT